MKSKEVVKKPDEQIEFEELLQLMFKEYSQSIIDCINNYKIENAQQYQVVYLDEPIIEDLVKNVMEIVINYGIEGEIQSKTLETFLPDSNSDGIECIDTSTLYDQLKFQELNKVWNNLTIEDLQYLVAIKKFGKILHDEENNFLLQLKNKTQDKYKFNVIDLVDDNFELTEREIIECKFKIIE